MVKNNTNNESERVLDNKKLKSKNFNADYYIDKPELYLLHKYENVLNNGKMLDIGIGFGRTTHYFAEVTKEYVGIDIQKDPVDLCKQRFKHLQNAKFYVCDARNMKIFEDNYFDVILFSYNGIDYVSHSERLLILKEINRICKQNGIIYFSTHNLQSIDNLFSFKFSFDPLKLIYSLRRKILLEINNPGITNIIKNASKMSYAEIIESGVIVDKGQNFKFCFYYISPDKQIEQLEKLGIEYINVISLSDGIEVKDKSKLKNLKDPWIYYLCRAPG